jgi:trehalose synthase
VWKDVAVTRLDPRRFDAVLDPAQGGRFLRRLEQAAHRLEGRRLWHLNSTEQGGGVAEMLQVLLGYLAGVEIDVRWVVVGGDERFFEVTKRLHNLLHGHPGDGNGLDRPERNVYQQTLQEAGERFDNKSPPATSSSCTTRRPWGSLRA